MKYCFILATDMLINKGRGGSHKEISITTDVFKSCILSKNKICYAARFITFFF